jgi:PAS domain S-box-containing protein
MLISATSAILVVAEDGRIQLANPQAKNNFGYQHDELIGLSVEALVPESFRVSHAHHRGEYLKDPSADRWT